MNLDADFTPLNHLNDQSFIETDDRHKKNQTNVKIQNRKVKIKHLHLEWRRGRGQCDGSYKDGGGGKPMTIFLFCPAYFVKG